MAVTTAPTATDVRVWAARKGIEVAAHGRLSAEVIDAYNKGRKNTYSATMVQPNLSPVLSVPGYKIGKGGRKTRVTEKVTASEVRAWARDNGIDVGDRGRIPAEVLVAFGNRALPADA